MFAGHMVHVLALPSQRLLIRKWAKLIALLQKVLLHREAGTYAHLQNKTAKKWVEKWSEAQQPLANQCTAYPSSAYLDVVLLPLLLLIASLPQSASLQGGGAHLFRLLVLLTNLSSGLKRDLKINPYRFWATFSSNPRSDLKTRWIITSDHHHRLLKAF